MEFHLRITVKADQSEKVVKQFVERFKPKLYIFSNEVSDQGVEHTHGHLEYEKKVPPKSTLSDWFKKLNLAGKYYHKEIEKEAINNKLYVVKDLDILYHNLTDEQLEELTNKTEEINLDKKTDIKIKLINEVKQILPSFKKIRVLQDPEDKDFKIEEEYYDIFLRDISQIIKNVYIDKYDKLPPTKSLMFQYCVFVAQKLKICTTEISQIYDNIF